MKPPSPLGSHLLLDLHGVAASLLAEPESIEQVLRAAAEAAGATVLLGHFHHFGEGQGVTGVLLLRESHISIHSWPEHGYAAIDIFMCGSAEPERAVKILLDAFQPAQIERHVQARGSQPLLRVVR